MKMDWKTYSTIMRRHLWDSKFQFSELNESGTETLWHRITSETTLLRHGYLAHTGASQWQRTIFQGGAIQPEHWQRNPEPEKIVQMVNACLSEEPTEMCLYVMLAKDSMLLTLQRDTTYMTLYNPADEYLQLIGQLASAVGLFVWSPSN